MQISLRLELRRQSNILITSPLEMVCPKRDRGISKTNI